MPENDLQPEIDSQSTAGSMQAASDSLVAEIVAITGVCEGVMPSEQAKLWAELAIWKNISPSDDTAKNLRMVLEAVGEPWDDDYLNDDGSPSLAALEAIHAQVQRKGGNANGPESSDAEDDEDEQFAAGEQEIVANTSLVNILTITGWVKDRRLKLNPDWQRSFVWKPRKQKALIESLLLGLPIPSFLIYKDRDTGMMSVIDGRQRLETISRFTHPKEARGEQRSRFRTFSSTQEGWRLGQYLNPAAGKFYDDLPAKFRAQFDTQNLQVAILDVPLTHLYQIFKRYNTGSVALNAAEIRNAVFQNSDLHEMMFRLGGEHRDLTKYRDVEEKQVGEDLRGIMKNKQYRYGAYDFIGRVLAFTHESMGSVATATFNFMTRENRANDVRVETFRKGFIDAFQATTEWYEYPLTDPRPNGSFHAFLATIQMVSTAAVLQLIREARASEEAAKHFIQQNWRKYAEESVLTQKQNSTNFWAFQKEWIRRLGDGARL